ncbi:MAG: hydantoinase B/oxoprolinase family protein [Actinobacteria bacterium]|nr:hydantoinase B/oxoprolinase family protein [Actinomycetota bacterium]
MLDVASFDPVAIRIFGNLFASIAEEMGVTLGRTAYSANIKERRDYSCAIFDKDLRLVAEGSHIPVHLGAMPLSLSESAKRIDFNPGDTVIVNDPFAGGTHLPDITLTSPIFLDEALIGFAVSRAHHADVGSHFPGSMGLGHTIHEEGVCISPSKLVAGSRIDERLLESFLQQVRNPKERLGDLKAQLAANEIGKSRFIDLVTKYGLDDIGKQIDNTIAYTRICTEILLQSMPSGTYSFIDYLDDDGFSDKPLKIEVAIKISGNRARIDFSGTDAQVESCVNAPLAVTHSAVYYVFRCLLPSTVLVNHGTFYPLTIKAPEGSLVNAAYPAGVAAGNVETSQRIVDVLLGALAQALPDRIPAASQGTMNNLSFGFKYPGGGEHTYYETIGGGMGAYPGKDGLSGVHTHMTNTLNTPIEALELAFPVRVRECSLRHGSGGNGKFSGGDGITRSIEFLEDSMVSILSDRRRTRPYGLNKGEPGASGRNILTCGDEEIELPGKTSFNVKAGDIVTIETPGGGGCGG